MCCLSHERLHSFKQKDVIDFGILKRLIYDPQRLENPKQRMKLRALSTCNFCRCWKSCFVYFLTLEFCKKETVDEQESRSNFSISARI